MSTNTSLFQILEGLNIDGVINFTHGSGAPSAGSTVGSIYLDNIAGNLYVYESTGNNGNPGWVAYASETYVLNQIAQSVNVQLTWQAPVELVDSTSTTLPTSSADSQIVIDSTTISNGQRVLFTGLPSNNNVYIYDQATGTFTANSSSPTAGDTVYVINTGQQYTYSELTLSWVLSNVTTVDELGYIRSFIGKSQSGEEVPTYTSTNVVTGSPNLEDAIGMLDADIGPSVSTSSFFVSPGNTINANLQALDKEAHTNAANIASLNTTVSNLVAGGGGGSSSSTSSATISGTTYTESSSGTLTLDTVTGKMAKWVVYVNDATASTLNTVEILAIQNEYYVDSSGAKGNQVFITSYGILETNGAIPGLEFNVDVPYLVSDTYSGLQLTVTANDPITAVVFRILEG